MALSPKKKILIGAIVLVEAALIVFGINYRINFNRDYELVSGSEFDESAVLEPIIDEPNFPTSFDDIDDWVLGFQVASTGRVSQQKIKDADSGEELGEATILETVSRDRGDPDNLIRLSLIVQFTPKENPDRNIMPWVLEEAAKLRDIEKIEEIFARGTRWFFIPLVDLNKEYLDQVPELVSYAQRYYGGSTHPQLAKLFPASPDNHPLLGEVSRPVFVLSTFEYMTDSPDKP